jgi:SpoVK/Ycf46/Vps4 family AAA+-type ATPase
MEEIKAELIGLRDILHGMRENGVSYAHSFNTILVGQSGTAKTHIAKLITTILHDYKMIQRSAPLVIEGDDLERLSSKDFVAHFDKAKGGVLFVDNAHKLIDQEGKASAGFARLISQMDLAKDDPVVLMAGLPFGFREFVKKADNMKIIGRFQNLFLIPDYRVDQYVAVTEYFLIDKGFTLDPEVRDVLLKRFRHLYKELKKADSEVRAQNGYLALKEAQGILGAYFKRMALDKVILPCDIAGPLEEKKSIAEIFADLNAIIGMDGLKAEIKSLYNVVTQLTAKKAQGAQVQLPAHHFIITGNPGTGKTKVARMLGRVFEGLGLLESGHVVEVDRSKLVAGFLGQTGPRTNEVCDQAMGGVLFIDEAYSLAKGGVTGDDFGKECIEALLKRMEDDRGKFIVIAAGYQQKMETFLTANDGLKSRFTKSFHIEDYTPTELTAIFDALAAEQGYKVTVEARERVMAFLKDRCARKTKDFANGREVRTLFDEVLNNQSNRLADPVDANRSVAPADLFLINAEDIPGTTAERGGNVEEALQELNSLVGLESVKTTIARILNTIQSQQLTGDAEVLSRHFVFYGNPGTGKTTVARILADVFKAIGLLPTANLIEADRSDLVAQFSGGTAPLVKEHCDRAMGGVLFIDEAYSLKQGASDRFGQEAVDVLLKQMEDARGKFVVLAAGYTREMDEFLDSNPGFRSRFTDHITFEDFTPPQLNEIFTAFAQKKGIAYAPDFPDALERRLRDLYERRSPSFANARTVRQVFDKTRENQSSRVMALKASGEADEVLKSEIRLMRPVDLDHTVTG